MNVVVNSAEVAQTLRDVQQRAKEKYGEGNFCIFGQFYPSSESADVPFIYIEYGVFTREEAEKLREIIIHREEISF